LKFNDLDGTLLYAGKFVFSFNESILSFDSLITTNSILDGIASIQYQKQTGKAISAFAAPKSIVTSGTLFKLRFKIADISSGATYITFDEATINETLSPKFRNGYFSITPLPSLSLTSPGLAEMYTGEKKQYTVTGGTAPYKWSVENTTFATINNTGNLSGISGGSTKVIVKDSYGSQASSNITIFDSWVNVRDSSAVVNNWVLLLPVDLGLNTNKGVLSISGSASCPSGKIDSIQVLNSGTLTQNWQLANKTGTNQANFAMSSAVPLVSGGKIINFKIYFKHTLQIGDVFYVNCNNLLLNEGAPNAKVKSGSVTIKNLFTGIEDIPLSVISVSPIPVTNELFIKMNPEFASSVISVVDLSGKTILTRTLANFDGSQFMLPVQSLAEGFYFLKLQSQKSNAVLKFIKR